MTWATHERPDGDRLALTADGVGLWTPWVAVGQVVEPGQVIGVVEVLGVIARVTSGGTRPGRAVAVTGGRHHRAPIDHGAVLVVLDPAIDLAAHAAAAHAHVAATGGLTFAAPSSGRFYSRPGPGKPAFVAVGDVVRTGQTVCMLEVMKTFHRVTFGGPGLPAAARVVAIAIADDDDVSPGDVILDLEPLDPEVLP